MGGRERVNESQKSRTRIEGKKQTKTGGWGWNTIAQIQLILNFQFYSVALVLLYCCSKSNITHSGGTTWSTYSTDQHDFRKAPCDNKLNPHVACYHQPSKEVLLVSTLCMCLGKASHISERIKYSAPACSLCGILHIK